LVLAACACNRKGVAQVPAICQLIDTHPFLIRLKLGHNKLSKGAQQAIVQHASQRNPCLFSSSWNLEREFATAPSSYGANAKGARTADSATCWVVDAEPADAPPFAEAFVVVDATVVAGGGGGGSSGGGGAVATAVVVMAMPVSGDGAGGGGGGK
jgi:hypothetical protein